jgi:hypothetical protein
VQGILGPINVTSRIHHVVGDAGGNPLFFTRCFAVVLSEA